MRPLILNGRRLGRKLRPTLKIRPGLVPRLTPEPTPGPTPGLTPGLTPGRTPKTNDHFLSPSRSETKGTEAWESSSPTTHQTWSPSRDKFGPWLLFLISLAVFLLIISVLFLTWAWFSSRESVRWRQLMLGPYSSQSITLTAVAIRFSVSMLAWMTSAMLASILLEKYGVPSHRIAEASISRYTGTLLPMVVYGYGLKKWFAVVIPFQLACAFASQFTSTILFSDIDTGVITGFPNEMLVYYDFSMVANPDSSNLLDPLSPKLEYPIDMLPDQDGLAENRWSGGPQSFEAFAEYAEPEKRIVAEGIDDTGPIIRAFLPIDVESERDMIQNYTGVTRVFDARTICARPKIRTLTTRRLGGGDFGGDNPASFNGTGFVDRTSLPDIFDGDGPTIEFSFECPAVEGQGSDDLLGQLGGPQWVFCRTTGLGGPLVARMSSLDPIFHFQDKIQGLKKEALITATYTSSDVEDPDGDDAVEGIAEYGGGDPIEDIRRGRLGSSFLLFGTTVPGGMIFPIGVNETAPSQDEMKILSADGKGPWLDLLARLRADQIPESIQLDENTGISSPVEDTDFTIRATFCFDVMMPESAPVNYLTVQTLGEKGRSREPRFSWNQDQFKYDTTEERRQLGATNLSLSHTERGIMSIDPTSIDAAIDNVVKTTLLQKMGSLQGDFVNGVFDPRPGTEPIIFCYHCDASPFKATARVAEYWEALFKDTMNETGSPALALQAVNTARARMAFMKWVSSFSRLGDGVVTMHVTAQIPERVAGYCTVISIITVQLLLLSIAWAAFLGTKNTLLNNAWLVLAQVAATREVSGVLGGATMMTDGDVRKRIDGGNDVEVATGIEDPKALYVVQDGRLRAHVRQNSTRATRFKFWRLPPL